MKVIDVSNYQHPNGATIDFVAVKNSGIDGVIIKATEGAGYTNPYFAGDVAAAHAAGLVVGAYHFARPSQGAAAAEATNFLNAVAGKPVSFCVLDSEDPGASGWDLRNWCLAWLNPVQAQTNAPPWIYSFASYLSNTLKGDGRFAAYPLWEAAYQSAPPAAPAPWSGHRLWQYTDTATVPGVPDAVDESTGDVTTAPAQPRHLEEEEEPVRIKAHRARSFPGGQNDAGYQTFLYASADSSDGHTANPTITCFFNGEGGPGNPDNLDIPVNAVKVIDTTLVANAPQGRFYARIVNNSDHDIDVVMRAFPRAA